jgi:hypothetical protein
MMYQPGLGVLASGSGGVANEFQHASNNMQRTCYFFGSPHRFFPDKFYIYIFCFLFASSDALAVRNEPLRHVCGN